MKLFEAIDKIDQLLDHIVALKSVNIMRINNLDTPESTLPISDIKRLLNVEIKELEDLYDTLSLIRNELAVRV